MNDLKPILTTILLLSANASVEAKTTESNIEKTRLSVGFAGTNSSEFVGQSLSFETPLAKVAEENPLELKATLYGGLNYLTLGEKNEDQTTSEVFIGMRFHLSGDTWVFIEDGYLQSERTSREQFHRDTGSMARIGIEDTLLKSLLPSKSGKYDGISLRLSYEWSSDLDDNFDGYRVDLGYRTPISVYYKSNFANDQHVYGLAFSHMF